ncbi:MAG TPA: alpha/beta fold hydrolase [Terriglobales bacterium]|nr:alpha/beta fold hydrolase [Terriglobales bacterium]
MNQKKNVTRARRILLRTGAVAGGLFLLGVIAISIAIHVAFDTEGVTADAQQGIATSKDGTPIAYEKTGKGPTIILVAAALADRGGTKRFAKLLSNHFTVINYDRRGRGKSGDTQPYAVEREVEDIDVLIGESGRPVFLFGSSSGAALALEAATRLGPKVKGLFLYEPPFIVNDSRPPVAKDLGSRISALVAGGRRSDAVTLFFTQGMGIPTVGVTLMRFLMPGWTKMTNVAHTLPYDLLVLEGTQDGKPLPTQRWTSNIARTLIMVGSRSESFFHSGAKELAGILPHAEYRILEGGTHGSVLLGPQKLVTAVEQFFETTGTGPE